MELHPHEAAVLTVLYQHEQIRTLQQIRDGWKRVYGWDVSDAQAREAMALAETKGYGHLTAEDVWVIAELPC